MRVWYEREGSAGQCRLVVRGRRAEPLDQRLAGAVAGARERHLAALVAFQERAGRATVRYDVTGLGTLRDFVRGKDLTSHTLLGFVGDLLGVLAWCASSHVGSMQLLLDPRHVYVREGAALCFVCLPLQRFSARHRGAPLELLASLCQGRHVSFADADAAALAERLYGHVSRANGVFSAMGLRSFLRAEQGVASKVGIVLRDARGHEVAALDGWHECIAGRAEGCDLRLPQNRLVSREHARIRAVAGGVMLCDLASTNGSEVAGCRLQPNEEVFVPQGGSFSLAGEEFYVQEGSVR